MYPPPAAPTCQVALDVRPDGFTFVAHVQYDRPDPRAFAPDDGNGRLLSSILRKVDDFVDRFREKYELDPRDHLEVLDENHRLRTALAECLTACQPLLGEPGDPSSCEGREGDHARAWLALEEARHLLGSGLVPCRSWS